jgi:hypothetical protein
MPAHAPSRHRPSRDEPTRHSPGGAAGAPAVSTDLAIFPASYYPDTLTLTPTVSENRGTSPLTGSTQRIRQPGAAAWNLEMTFTNRYGAERAELMAFFTKLRVGNQGFLMQIREPRRGQQVGSDTIIAVSSQTGSVLRVFNDGISAVHSQFRSGDYLTVNSHELKMVLNDVRANSSSNISSLQIYPPIRTVPTSGDAIYGTSVNSIAGAFRLTQVVEFSTKPPNYETDFVVKAIEHINSVAVVDY